MSKEPESELFHPENLVELPYQLYTRVGEGREKMAENIVRKKEIGGCPGIEPGRAIIRTTPCGHSRI